MRADPASRPDSIHLPEGRATVSGGVRAEAVRQLAREQGNPAAEEISARAAVRDHLRMRGGKRVLLTSAYPEGSYLPLFRQLAEQDRFRIHSLTDDPADADIILFVDARTGHNDWRLSAIRRHPLVARYREKAFVYNEIDQPWCAIPGLYVSMPRRFFKSQRQRACRGIVEVNPYIAAQREAQRAPDLLFSFIGQCSHRVREAILRLCHPRAHIEDTSGLNFFGTPGAEIEARKRHYAEIMYRSKFVLCPRGFGTASFRLFEAMAAGRVPVIISDSWVRPTGPDWDSFALTIRESEVASLPTLLESCEERFDSMATAARHAWEEWFAPDVLFHRMVESCSEILQSRRLPEQIRQRLPDLRYLELSARNAGRPVRDALRRTAHRLRRKQGDVQKSAGSG